MFFGIGPFCTSHSLHWLLTGQFSMEMWQFQSSYFEIKSGTPVFWKRFSFFWKFVSKSKYWKRWTDLELAIRNLQCPKHFGSLPMSFCIFSKNCELLNSDTSWIFRVIHWTSYIVSYFKPIKYPLLNNNLISQKFIVHINFKLHTSFFSNYRFVTI